LGKPVTGFFFSWQEPAPRIFSAEALDALNRTKEAFAFSLAK
jgi:hypothetical protein